MASKQIRLVLFALLSAAAGAAGLAVWHHAGTPVSARAAPAVPVSVVAAKVTAHDVPIYMRGVGTVTAYNNVVMHSQITGQIVKIAFRQDQTVRKGNQHAKTN